METLFLVDASGYLYRSYHAIRGMTNAKGESTNALFGFIRSLSRLIKDFEPRYLAAVFDGPRSLEARKALYEQYKAHRVEMPGDLRYQIAWARHYCQLAGIPEFALEGVEADDGLASMAKWAEEKGAHVFLCTSDKDMAQLVSPRIQLLNTFKENLVMGAEEVRQTYGVRPDQIVDWLAMTGDTSDNVPGIPGFGPKTAAALLEEFGSLDAVFAHAEKLPAKKREVLLQNRDQAYLSRELVKVDTAVPFPADPSAFALKEPQQESLREFYAQMNFLSLLRELGEASPQKPLVEPLLIEEESALTALLAQLRKAPEICLHTVKSEGSPLRMEMVGIGLGLSPQTTWYIPLNGALGKKKVLEALKPVFEDSSLLFYGHDIKSDYQALANEGINLANMHFDTLLAAYLLNPQQRRHSLEDLVLDLFSCHKTSLETLVGKGRQKVALTEVPLEKMAAYCCEELHYIARLKELFEEKLDKSSLLSVLKEIELPLLYVLARMERQGVYVDGKCLFHMREEIAKQSAHLEEEIYVLAGERFNINSPKQLSDILYHKMGIKPLRKTATGLSTSADVLEALSEECALAGKVLEYRSFEKLRSTYIDALPHEINTRTGRVHPHFNQSIAATGRLSCQDPNLQNIPIRTPTGRKIRSAFRPQRAGWSFLSADYSQIELRLLAHLSEDPQLLEAFSQNQDIHAYTASLVFGIPIAEVTKEHRYRAKAVNFGVIYGQQAFGLGRELGIDVKAAATFIELYFQRYPQVRAYVERSIQEARASGKAVTMSGRERKILEINSSNANLRSAAERLAINTPLQGGAADLIKMAMITIDRELERLGKKSFMVLQIHDELLFEVPDEEIAEVSVMVRASMENAMTLKVPLLVDLKVGKNWEEC